jgi:3-isopropylmalate/(R)-2-methylmalate dehydratase small subunit
MHAFTIHDGLVVPLDRAHVNTDDIIPARYLTAVERTGFADGLFTNWRYLPENGQLDPAFPLNQPRYQGVTILLTRENFGCGSSREHAPWALSEYGFRAIIAPNFADIFYNNCLNIGLLPIPLEADQVQALFAECEAREGYTLHIDLEQQIVQLPGDHSLRFSIDAFRKASLLQGLDAIGKTLQQEDRILAYENRRKQATPWYVA